MPTIAPREDFTVPSDVWAQIAPAGPAADRIERRATRRAGLLLVLSAAVVLLIGWSGALGPRISLGDHGGSDGSNRSRTVQEFYAVDNSTPIPTTVAGASTDLPGVRVLSARTEPARLGALAAGELQVAYEVTDCAAARRWASAAGLRAPGPQVLHLRSSAWFGSATSDLDVGHLSSLGFLVGEACSLP